MEFGSAPISAMRVSNEERSVAVQRLNDAFSEGRFDAGELEERLEQAMTAKTRGDLESALRQLPPAWSEVRVDTGLSRSTDAGSAASATGMERIGGSAAHLLGYPTLFVGPALVAALARSRYVREHAIEAANFQLTFFGAVFAVVMVAVVTLGLGGLALPFLGLLWFVFTGVGGLAALVGNRFRYPWAVRLLKP